MNLEAEVILEEAVTFDPFDGRENSHDSFGCQVKWGIEDFEEINKGDVGDAPSEK